MNGGDPGDRVRSDATAGGGPHDSPPARRWRPDWSGFSWRLGAVATALMVAIMLASRQFGAVGLFAGMGALQALLASVAAPMRVRPWAAFWFAAVGVGATALAGVVAKDHASAVTALAAIAFLAGCGLAVGPVVARMTNVMALWFLTAVALLTGETEFSRPALGFLAGSVAVFALLELWKRVQGIRLEPLPPLADRMRQGLAWGSPVLRYAVVSAAAGAAALWLGWEVLPDNRVWAAATALVLVRPAARESLAMTVQRLAGTALGAWLAVSVIGRIEDPRLLLPLALLATFLMAATLKVDYAIFATFLTAQVVALAALAGEDPLRTSQDRVLATLLGAGIALAATLVLRLGAPPGDGEDAPG